MEGLVCRLFFEGELSASYGCAIFPGSSVMLRNQGLSACLYQTSKTQSVFCLTQAEVGAQMDTHPTNFIPHN